MPHQKPSLRQDVEMSDEKCDKGPILNRIVDHVERLDKHAERSEVFQSKMSEALISIAGHQEKILAVADKTQRNETDIQHLFKLNRETETNITDHILSPRHSPQGKTDTRFDKVQVAVVTAALLGGCAFVWKFIQTVMVFMTQSGGI
jgi:hypothetical protein